MEDNPFGSFGPSLTALLQFFLPFISQSTHSLFIGGGGNPYTNLRTMQFQRQFLGLLASAGQYDERTIYRQFQGAANLLGIRWTPEIARSASALIPRWLPIAEMFFPGAASVVDRLMGQRGSAFIMAQQMFPGLAQRVDPITGMRGMTLESMQALMGAMVAPYFVGDQFRTQYAGLRMGEIGGLFSALQRQGMLPGTAVDWTRVQFEGRAREELQRVLVEAERLGAPVGAFLTGREGRRRLRPGISAEEIASLPADVLAELQTVPEVAAQVRQLDAGKIKSTLAAYSRTIRALKEIFGEEGRGDAPIPELLRTLSALTSSQLRGDPERAERELRTTLNLARATGVTTAELGVRMASLSQTAAVMGLSPNMAVQALRVGLETERAYAAGGYAGLPGYASPEQVRGQIERRFLMAARSGGARTLATLAYVAEALNPEAARRPGGQPFKEGTEAAAMWQALQMGETTYEFEGRRKNLLQTPEAMLRALERSETGFTGAELRRFIVSETVAEQFAESPLARAILPLAQVEELETFLAQDMARVAGLTPLLRPFAEGREGRRFMTDLGREIIDEAAKQGATGAAGFQKALETVVQRRAKQGDKQAAALQADLERQPEATRKAAAGLWAAFADYARQARPGERPQEILGQIAAVRQARPYRLEEEANAYLQSLFADLAEESPLRRLTEAIISATPETTLADVLVKTAGGIGIKDIQQRLGEGGQKALEEFRQSSQEYQAVAALLRRVDISREEKWRLIRRQGQLEQAMRGQLERIREIGGQAGLLEAPSPMERFALLPKQMQDVREAIESAAAGKLSEKQQKVLKETGTEVLHQIAQISESISRDDFLKRRFGAKAESLRQHREAFETLLREKGTTLDAFLSGKAGRQIYADEDIRDTYAAMMRVASELYAAREEPYAGLEWLLTGDAEKRKRLASIAEKITQGKAAQGAVLRLLETPGQALEAVMAQQKFTEVDRELVRQAKKAYDDRQERLANETEKAKEKEKAPAAAAADAAAARATGRPAPAKDAREAAAAERGGEPGKPPSKPPETTVAKIHIGTLYVRWDGSGEIVPTPS